MAMFDILPLVLILGVICGLYSGVVAGAKGYDSAIWFIGGLLLGPLALLASVGLPDLKLRRYLRLLAEHQGAVDKDEPPSPPAPRNAQPSLPPPGEEVAAQHRRIFGRVAPIPPAGNGPDIGVVS